jgi:hypothetical protein
MFTVKFFSLVDLYHLFNILMITETRQSRTHFLHTYERYPRRRHHTLDNATLDKFNFICVPLHSDEVNLFVLD